ncbi:MULTISPECIES: hypothetical protein [Azospirillum]|uniref:Lana protein n=1 Tax=Azospirillum brasilense TaxID=192 RepID=A0ABU4PIC7_AZOBR|nr:MULTISPECIES: hypothetical protein [Azospirillum]MBY3755983.1 hypothetical protein [Azospirillum formosense]MDW7556048.1 hypothetical protein [Azospirillum brasilense]MDW7596018.1 hypothetical protein [Azospirillum brasilense]MDW7631104.1 hypothetical protein [Azospirillum brasilense]MDX5955112.1 hypothetical protein [Azospirillum brasilense]
MADERNPNQMGSQNERKQGQQTQDNPKNRQQGQDQANRRQQDMDRDQDEKGGQQR